MWVVHATLMLHVWLLVATLLLRLMKLMLRVAVVCDQCDWRGCALMVVRVEGHAVCVVLRLYMPL